MAAKIQVLVAAGLIAEVTLADPAWAVQSHGGAEGLVAHQIGHALFAAGMVYLLVRIWNLRLNGPGWRAFRWFLGLLILWNVATFANHQLHELVGNNRPFRGEAETWLFAARTLPEVLYYVTSLDHLVLVPALLFLLLALRTWGAQR